MEMDQLDPEEMNLEDLVDRGSTFHGHLGPYLVAGIRMGVLGLKELNSAGHKDLEATVKTGTTPPMSCIIDGIQVATGCTTGKGNLKVSFEERPEALFSRQDQQLTIGLTEEAVQVIERQEPVPGAQTFKNMPKGDLFKWHKRP